jgi:hypothetical protein
MMICRDLPSSSVTCRLHSKAAGACAIHGDATLVPGIAVNPASFSSSTPRGHLEPQTCIASAKRERDDIDGEDFRHPNIVAGILEGHIGVVLHAQSEDRRIGRQTI